MVALRIERHQHIRQVMSAAKYDTAIGLIHDLIKTQGQHIGLLCDLAVCLCETGRYHDFKEVVLLIQKEMDSVAGLLSSDSRYRTYLCLAKFYEELAEPAMALEYLSKISETMDDILSKLTYSEEIQNDKIEIKKWVHINELRILSYFGKTKDLQKRYLQVLEYYNSNQNLKIEILHGLMWAEWSIFGFASAVSRFDELEAMVTEESDQRLICRDFIEIVLLSPETERKKAQATIRKALEKYMQLVGLDYDRSLFALLEGKDLATLEPLVVSKMMRLRLLLLQLSNESRGDQQSLLKKKFLFLIEDSSKKSAQLFLGLDLLISLKEEQTVVFYQKTRRLQYGSKSAEARLTQNQADFLSLMSGKSSLSLDEVAQYLWQMDFDENIYHRIRMMVNRLNTSIAKVIGEKAYVVKKSGVYTSKVLKVEMK